MKRIKKKKEKDRTDTIKKKSLNLIEFNCFYANTSLFCTYLFLLSLSNGERRKVDR